MAIRIQSYSQLSPYPVQVPVYFEPKYAQGHQSDSLVVAQGLDSSNIQFSCHLTDVGASAKSYGHAPYGSILCLQQASLEQFRSFWTEVVADLKNREIKTIELVHPVSFYEGFVPIEWLEAVGFSAKHWDYNQHIAEPPRYHPMQRRKLSKLRSADVEFHQTNDFDRLHDFLSKCRAEQNLKINIGKPELLRLTRLLPDRFEGWVAVKNDEWISALLMTNVFSGIRYYYLPGTPIAYKHLSPMVGLIDHLVHQYPEDIIDLGVSSQAGVKQNGLFTFKERMGAQWLKKFTFEMSI